MNTDALARITPGLSRLVEKDPDHFEAIADVKIGPVKGSFSGDLRIKDKVPDESFQLHVKQKSKIGNVDAKVDIQLAEESPGATLLTFDGKAHMSGLLARTGSRVMSGVANSLSQQFFDELEKELSTA